MACEHIDMGGHTIDVPAHLQTTRYQEMGSEVEMLGKVEANNPLTAYLASLDEQMCIAP